LSFAITFQFFLPCYAARYSGGAEVPPFSGFEEGVKFAAHDEILVGIGGVCSTLVLVPRLGAIPCKCRSLFNLAFFFRFCISNGCQIDAPTAGS
jgi:hypothetical protein